jgi:hypothetical protein
METSEKRRGDEHDDHNNIEDNDHDLDQPYVGRIMTSKGRISLGH